MMMYSDITLLMLLFLLCITLTTSQSSDFYDEYDAVSREKRISRDNQLADILRANIGNTRIRPNSKPRMSGNVGSPMQVLSGIVGRLRKNKQASNHRARMNNKGR